MISKLSLKIYVYFENSSKKMLEKDNGYVSSSSVRAAIAQRASKQIVIGMDVL